MSNGSPPAFLSNQKLHQSCLPVASFYFGGVPSVSCTRWRGALEYRQRRYALARPTTTPVLQLNVSTLVYFRCEGVHRDWNPVWWATEGKSRVDLTNIHTAPGQWDIGLLDMRR